jgi:hypothetical protein
MPREKKNTVHRQQEPGQKGEKGGKTQHTYTKDKEQEMGDRRQKETGTHRRAPLPYPYPYSPSCYPLSDPRPFPTISASHTHPLHASLLTRPTIPHPKI